MVGVVAVVFALLPVLAWRKLMIRPGDMLRVGRVAWALVVVIGAVTLARGVMRPGGDAWLVLSGGAEVLFGVMNLSAFRRRPRA